MADRAALLGSWKLVSIQLRFSDNGEIIDLYGPNPLGFVLFGPSGRMVAMITPSGLRSAPSGGGYSGRYRIEDNVLITEVDVAIQPSQVGTEQRRSIHLAGDTLTLVTPEQTFAQTGDRLVTGIAVWERERAGDPKPV